MPNTLTITLAVNMARLHAQSTKGKMEDMPEKLAEGITKEYINAVKGAVNPVINNKLLATYTSPASPNVIAFKSCLLNAFMTAMTDITSTGNVANSALKKAFMLAPKLFWKDTKLEGVFKGSPPGHIGIVPPINNVSQGEVPNIIIPTNSIPLPPLAFYTHVAVAWTAHLATLKFMCPAIIPAPTASPYPLTLVSMI